VRGRTADSVLDDPDVRAGLMLEVGEDLDRAPAPVLADPDAIALEVRSYPSHKLK
jgi:hypothetical protein